MFVSVCWPSVQETTLLFAPRTAGIGSSAPTTLQTQSNYSYFNDCWTSNGGDVVPSFINSGVPGLVNNSTSLGHTWKYHWTRLRILKTSNKPQPLRRYKPVPGDLLWRPPWDKPKRKKKNGEAQVGSLFWNDHRTLQQSTFGRCLETIHPVTFFREAPLSDNNRSYTRNPVNRCVWFITGCVYFHK